MSQIHIVGDHHGNHEHLLENLDGHGIKDTILIHVGDGHEGYSAGSLAIMEELNEEFRQRRIHYLTIRGNHSDPSWFKGGHNWSNIRLLPDYTRMNLDGESWLFIGGAISINRLSKMESGTWWEEEEFQFVPEKCKPTQNLVTHSAPRWLGPSPESAYHTMEHCFEKEKEHGVMCLPSQLEEERINHEKVFAKVKPRNWYAGHFHTGNTVRKDGCLARLLAMHQIQKHPF